MRINISFTFLPSQTNKYIMVILPTLLYIRLGHWPNEKGVRQWSRRLGFNPWLGHTKDSLCNFKSVLTNVTLRPVCAYFVYVCKAEIVYIPEWINTSVAWYLLMCRILIWKFHWKMFHLWLIFTTKLYKSGALTNKATYLKNKYFSVKISAFSIIRLRYYIHIYIKVKLVTILESYLRTHF